MIEIKLLCLQKIQKLNYFTKGNVLIKMIKLS